MVSQKDSAQGDGNKKTGFCPFLKNFSYDIQR
jgi:hypothetical protein